MRRRRRRKGLEEEEERGGGGDAPLVEFDEGVLAGRFGVFVECPKRMR